MSSRVEKVERVADLLLLLLNAREPLTLVEIGAQVKGYPAEEEARRTQFERDKRTLRESGIPITVSAPNSSAQDGYRILPADYYLPDLGLDEHEVNALRLALATIRLEGTMFAEIAVKIGASPDALVPAVMELPRAPALGALGQAIRDGATATFTYRGRRRLVDPAVLVFRAGHWYLVGDERAGDARDRRTYRVDRVEGAVALGAPRSAAEMEIGSVDQALAFSLRGEGEQPRVELLVDAAATAAVIEMVGRDAVIDRDDEGRAHVTFAIAEPAAVISWVLGLGPAAEVLGPEPLRSAVIARLEEHAAESTGETGDVLDGAPIAAPGTPRARVLDAGARLRRIIAMLTYLADVESAPVADLAAKFDADERTVVSELELAACFGLPPYTPDQLLEILVVGDDVRVHRLEALGRPLRLTPDEGFALAASARTLLSTTGVAPDSALATALRKLEAVLGENRVRVDVELPPALGELQSAASRNAVVEFTYAGREGPERRRAEAYAVVFREGRFYLDAYCLDRNDWRRFAVVNVSDVTAGAASGHARTPPPEFAGARAFVERATTPRATIVVPSDRAYFLEAVAPGPFRDAGDGRVVATIPVGEASWLGALMLRLGPGSSVVAPPELRDVRQKAAAATLARYRR